MIQRARLDPHGLVRLLELLEREQGREPAGVHYFSTHPSTPGRTSAMRALAASAAYAPRKLLSGVTWPPPFVRCGQSDGPLTQPRRDSSSR